MQQHAGAEQQPRRDHLNRRHGKAERTGTGDDQHGNRDHQRMLPVGTKEIPAGEGEQRGEMDHRRIEAGHPVGELDIARAGLRGGFQQARHLVEQRRAGGDRHLYGQAGGGVGGAGINGIARSDGGQRRLAGDEALVDLRAATDDAAVQRHALAGAHMDQCARLDPRQRHLAQGAVWPLDHCRLGLERGDVFGEGPCPPAHRVVEIAADQQEEQEHHGGFEIGVMGRLDGLHDREEQREADADDDRHIHVEPARGQRCEGRAQERPAGIDGGRQRDQRRDPVEEVAGFRLDAAGIARPDRDRQQHDVHHGKAGDGQRAQQFAPRRIGALAHIRRIEGMGPVAEPRQHVDDPLGVRLLLPPVDGKAVAGQVEAGLLDAGHERETMLDLGHAGGTGHPFDGEVHMRLAVVLQRDECVPVALMHGHVACRLSSPAAYSEKKMRFCERKVSPSVPELASSCRIQRPAATSSACAE